MGPFYDSRNLVPVEFTIHIDSNPSPVTYVRRAKVAFSPCLEERFLRSSRCCTPDSLAVVMMPIRKTQEGFLPANKEARLTVTEPFRNLRQC